MLNGAERRLVSQREYGNTAILEIIEAHEGKKVSGYVASVIGG